ncbi:Alpha/beta hydrolase [Fusarium sp. LHS14.1]|nr:Alpha/beta hydrolase [Fusarium sp. LHS14.1]
MDSKTNLRRGWVHRLALSITAFALAPVSLALETYDADAHGRTTSTAKRVTFKTHYGIDIAGNEYHPPGFDRNNKYAATIHVSPASGTKEQTAGLYAQKHAEEGFGESGGEPRFQENSIARVEDIRGAVDYLVSLPYVDETRIGVLGICAGGGYAASVAMTERRISAVGLVVPVNGGRENRAGGREAKISSLESIAQLRSAEARGGEPTIMEWMPDSYRNSTDIDQREAYDYYRTPRASHPNWQNKVRFSTMDAVMAFDAFYLADMLLTQPLQIVVGSVQGSFGSNRDGHHIFEVAASKNKDIMVVEGASHFDMYDQPGYVGRAVAKMSAFFKANLR